MKCREAEKRMVRLLSGDLEPGERLKLRAHCRACPVCSRKNAEVEEDLKWMAQLPSGRPEFDWEASWNAIRTRMGREIPPRERRHPLVRMLLPAASLGMLILGFVIWRYFIFPPVPEASVRPPESSLAGRLIRKHMDEVGTAFLEYMNRETSEADQRILVFEKQQALFLLFQNRTLRACLKRGDSPMVIPLLDDLEIVLYETANLQADIPEAHEFIKSLIRQREILFRVRYMGNFFRDKAGEGVSS
jgi:hypothetical protein